MADGDLGNKLNRIVFDAQAALFDQGELAELSYGAFDMAATYIQASDNKEITINFPIGWNADNTAMHGTKQYKKEELLERYKHLAFQQLSINGLVQLVTIVEAMLGDIVRAVVLKYPQKLGAKRSMKLSTVLECDSIEEIHLRATDSLINELSYKSPTELAELMQELISTNLLECPAFHSYMEIKASRDIFIHNLGIANDVYERKSGSHMRVKSGMQLPIDTVYFLRSYESCLQFCEWLEEKLHDKWHSSAREEHKKQQLEMKLQGST